MITKKLKIVSISDEDLVKTKSNNYSYAFRFLLKTFDVSSDKKHINYVKNRFNLNDMEYRSLSSMVKAKLVSIEVNKEKIIERINDLTDKLNNDTKLTKRDKFKIFRKIQHLKYSVKSNCVFGGKSLLKKITREYNKKDNKDLSKLNDWLTEYRFIRNNMPFFSVGEANEKGNRFYDFKNIHNGYVIYKPKHGIKCEINFKVCKNQLNDLYKLSELTESKDIPISVSLNTEYIYFTYDEEKLNGYSVNEIDRRKEISEIKKQGFVKEQEVKLIKETYRKYYDEQLERKLNGKIKNRCCSVDLNPTNIGYSILDLNDDNTIKIVHCGCFDLSKLCIKLGKSSNSKEQKYQNNKRKYELTIILKKLFNIISHYKCGKFIMEKLTINKKDGEINNSESNRKINNLWDRGLIINIIKRRCNEKGIILEEVNPCYSSFIGNIQYGYIDSVNASIEIGRRGLLKYVSGTFYPHITEDDIHTMVSKFGIDVEYNSSCNWVSMYKFLVQSFNGVEFSQRLRTSLDNIRKDSYSKYSMSSYKSKTNYIKFN